jgi:hypothetical protein
MDYDEAPPEQISKKLDKSFEEEEDEENEFSVKDDDNDDESDGGHNWYVFLLF